MAEQKAKGGGTGALAGADRQAADTSRLKEELEKYVEARLQMALEDIGHRMGEGARRLGQAHLGPGRLAGAVAKGGGKLGRRLVSSGAGVLTSTACHAKDAVLDKVKSVTGTSLSGKDLSSGAHSMGRGLAIIEDIDVGVPVREAYDQWTQFQDFDRFTKGVVGVEQEDDTTTKWHVKVAKAKRHWTGTTTEQVPDERIAWTSEGTRGNTQGVVTFHPLGENLTKVLLVLRYFPKGPVERIGNLVRAQGRRARLDLKLYRTFLMMRGEATGGWRGEIRDGEVVRAHEEAEGAEGAEGEGEEEPEAEGAEEEPEERYAEDEGEGEEELEAEEDEEGGDEPEAEEDEWEEDEEEGREPDDRYDDTEEEPRTTRRRRG